MAAVFGLDCQINYTVTLLQELDYANSPVLVSPLYLTFSVIFAYAFSAGNTFEESISFLTCIPDDQKVPSYNSTQETFANAIQGFTGMDSEIFAQLGLRLLPILSEDLKKTGKKAHRLDFKSSEAVQSVNKMIANMTNQRITQIVNTLNPDTASVLLMDSTFEDKWKVKFNEPKNGTFYVNATTKKTIPMLQQTSAEFGYLETEHFHALRLPFDDNSAHKKNCVMDTNRTKRKHKCSKNEKGSLYFLVFLPQKRFGLPEALDNLKGSTIRKLMQTNNSKIDLTLPSFDLEHTTTFDHQLRKIGVKKLFDPKKADIPKMFSERVYAGGFTQKIQFKINSTGNDIVMGTADQMILQKRSKRAAYKKIEVDEPFVYMVYHDFTNASPILYAGIFH